MPYDVHEIFYTLQGEGMHSGRPALFIRFARCNLWDGTEAGRATARCRFCDTDFLGGLSFPDAEALVRAAIALWPHTTDIRPYVVLTGGEPALHMTPSLIEALHRVKAEIAVETNGTLPLPSDLDWICVSPKAGTRLRVTRGDELKLVYPQEGLEPDSVAHLDFAHFFLQPLDGPNLQANLQATLEYCLRHPQWRISLQTHKILNIP